MPAAVKKAMRHKSGPAAAWYRERTRSQSSECYVLIRRSTDHATVGWLCGISMFEDNYGILGVALNEASRPVLAAMIDAFVAGLRADVPPSRHLWTRLEKVIAKLGGVPANLRDELPRALMSASAEERGVGLRLAKKSDARAIIERAAKQASPAGKKRLAAALSALGGAKEVAAGAPLRASSKAELEVMWLGRAANKDPADLDVLLNTPWPGAWKTASARVHALREFPLDARIAKVLPSVRDKYPSWAAGPLRGSITALAKKHAAAPASTHSADLAQLWAQFHAKPDDLALRAVLGDALQAAGDPRGEYIALSMNGETVAAKKRAAALLATNVETWAAGVPNTTKVLRRFENGFLTAVGLTTSTEVLAKFVTEPVWRTVTELHVTRDGRSYADAAPVFEQLFANMPLLTAFIANWYELDKKLTGPVPNIRVAAWDWPQPRKVFPALEMLVRDQAITDLLAETHDVPILFAFTSRSTLAEVLAHYAATPRVPELRFATELHELGHRGWLLRVHAGAVTATLSWGSGRYVPGSLTSAVNTLAAAGRREISVAPPALGRAAVEAEARSIKTAAIEWLAKPLATWQI